MPVCCCRAAAAALLSIWLQLVGLLGAAAAAVVVAFAAAEYHLVGQLAVPQTPMVLERTLAVPVATAAVVGPAVAWAAWHDQPPCPPSCGARGVWQQCAASDDPPCLFNSTQSRPQRYRWCAAHA